MTNSNSPWLFIIRLRHCTETLGLSQNSQDFSNGAAAAASSRNLLVMHSLELLPKPANQKLSILPAFLIQAEAGEVLSKINTRKLNGDVVLFFCSFSIGEKNQFHQLIQSALIHSENLKSTSVFGSLGNFLEKHFNMLSTHTHTHTHTHTQHTHDLSVISSNKVKFSEPGLEWNLEPSLSCYVEWRGAIFVNISMCRVLFPYLYPTAQQGVQAEGMRENKKEL